MTDGWYRNARGNMVKRWGPPPSAVARSHLACPMIAGDTLDTPLQSAADGKFYTSKAAMRASYLPSGNPQGERYNEVGNDTQASVSAPAKSGPSIETSIKKALARAGHA